MRFARLLALAALAGLAAPGGAAAAGLEPLKPCYVSVDKHQRELVEVHGFGFTPGSHVDVAVDGETQFSVPVYGDGLVSGKALAPFQRRGERDFELTLSEDGNPANTVSGLARVTGLSVKLSPRRAPSSSRVRFVGRGFTAMRPVYGHYVFAGMLRRTVRLGWPSGPCGTFNVRRRQIPLEDPRDGSWTLQVDQQRAYSPSPDGVSVMVTIRVRRSFTRP
jgi:hypothetical protein